MYLQKVISKKSNKNLFLLASRRSMTKIAESGSGSISREAWIRGSADPDPDPHKNVTDPQDRNTAFRAWCLYRYFLHGFNKPLLRLANVSDQESTGSVGSVRTRTGDGNHRDNFLAMVSSLFQLSSQSRGFLSRLLIFKSKGPGLWISLAHHPMQNCF
jgi:hypothetical protein